MAAPKSLIFQLHKYWEVIEFLVQGSRDLPAFEVSQVLLAIERFSGHDAPDPTATLNSLCSADLLQPLGRSEDLQLNPLVLEFVRGLTKEHELGLSTVLKARVDAIRDATQRLAMGLEQQQMDDIRVGAGQLSELFRQIMQQLDQDRHAIFELVEQAKAGDAAMPIALRYRTVLDAYDHYVEPMNEMMDSGLGGSFYPHLELALQTLDKAEEYLSVRGALYSQRLQLRLISQQAKELRRLGRVVAQQCADTLLPLREEIRQLNQLSTAISDLLGRVRKRGLRSLWRHTAANDTRPGWHRERRTRLHLGDDIRTLMAQALHFEPQVQAFPDALPGASTALAAWVDEAHLRQALAKSLPIDNLLLWLQAYDSQLPDATILRLYHDLIREPNWQAQQDGAQTESTLHQVSVRYYPHQLHPLTSENNRSLG